MPRPGRVALALLAAIVLAACSVLVQRRGPELGQTGNLCGPQMNEICWAPRVNGGFPFAFLFDNPGVSVPDALGIGEDDFRWPPFLADVVFWLLLLLLLARSWRRVAGRRRAGSIPGG